MFLITSAAYINQEFSSELGRLPPSFLPVGNRRLYRYQHEVLSQQEPIVLTLPEQYDPPEYDRKQLETMGIELLFIPEGLSLGESIVCALNLLGHSRGALRILHGDTLIYDLPLEDLDVVTLSPVDDNYSWAVFDSEQEKPLSQLESSDLLDRRCESVVNGYFAFSDARLLIQSITRARGSFIDGINGYARLQPLRAKECHQWFDFGHLHTYYRSRTHVSTTRAFNSLAVNRGTVVKRSHKLEKMRAEANWISTLPADLQRFTPKLFRSIDGPEGAGYELEYLCLISLNELFVFGALPHFVWRKVFEACDDFLSHCRKHAAPTSTKLHSERLFAEKTRQRLDEFSRMRGIDLDASWTFNNEKLSGINHIAGRAAEFIPPTQHWCVTHGDFCFSNVLYDFRSQSIKVIDPRGLDADGNLTIYGDPNYDLAKLAHSAIGRYDMIIAGYFELVQQQQSLHFVLPERDVHQQVESMFFELCEKQYGLSKKQLLAMQVHLFLSMLPLHDDDENRQMALLANALRLYLRLESFS